LNSTRSASRKVPGAMIKASKAFKLAAEALVRSYPSAPALSFSTALRRSWRAVGRDRRRCVTLCKHV
jgi:hypothetical protein